MLELIALVTTTAITVLGYFRTRNFVARRLTYVDAIQTPVAPLLVGAAAAAIATPITWVLPLVGGGTALLFGMGVGAGVATGRRLNRHRLPAA